VPSAARKEPNGRIRWRLFLYAAAATVLLALFLSIFLALTLSPDLFIRLGLNELERAAAIQVRYGTGHFRLRGVVLRDVILDPASSAPSSASASVISMQRVVVRPSLVGLIGGRRGRPWTVLAELYEGSAKLILDGRGDAWKATLDWSQINLNRVHLWQGKPDFLGLSDGRVSLSAPGPGGVPVIEGSWSAVGTDITAVGLKSGHLLLPPITLSTLRTTGEWTGRRATVTTFDARGPFGRLHLSGKLVLRTPIENTGLNMTMTHVASKDAPRELEILLRILLPRPAAADGSTYHVAGTLAMPMVTAVDDS